MCFPHEVKLVLSRQSNRFTHLGIWAVRSSILIVVGVLFQACANTAPATDSATPAAARPPDQRRAWLERSEVAERVTEAANPSPDVVATLAERKDAAIDRVPVEVLAQLTPSNPEMEYAELMHNEGFGMPITLETMKVGSTSVAIAEVSQIGQRFRSSRSPSGNYSQKDYIPVVFSVREMLWSRRPEVSMYVIADDYPIHPDSGKYTPQWGSRIHLAATSVGDSGMVFVYCASEENGRESPLWLDLFKMRDALRLQGNSAEACDLLNWYQFAGDRAYSFASRSENGAWDVLPIQELRARAAR